MSSLVEGALTGEGLDEVIAFMRTANPFAQHVWGWDTGRFIDFRWGSNNIRADWGTEWFEENCRVFRRDGAIIALAIAEEGNEYECIITRQAEPEVVAPILDTLIARHRERSVGISLEFTRDEEWLREVCRSAGLTEAENTGHEWEYDLSEVDLTVEVPDEYTVVTLAARPEIDRGAVARCIERAFESTRDLERMVVNIEDNPMFLPELTVMAIHMDGTVAAYCRGTVDPENGVCGIDPVCTDPDHHRRGLGKAAVRRLMANQRGLGGRYAYIGSAPPPAPGTFLYQSLGPSRLFTACGWSG